MASVIVQVGQCGNQIGEQFWNRVLSYQNSNNGHVYTHPEGKLRSVNVDSESKVVRQLIRNLPQEAIREKNVVLGRRGRGTNWALGYYGNKASGEDHILQDSMESLRHEVERCDSFSGVIVLHSISGGTGSGVGSHLSLLIKEEYPMNFMMNCVVAPHASGESPLQHYNSLLCLDHLQKLSDAMVWFHNDEVLARLERRNPGADSGTKHSPEGATHRGKKSAADRGVSMNRMNEHIASCLAGVFLPVETLTPAGGLSIGLEPWEMLRAVCPMPSLKFAHINHLARRKLSWENLTGSCLHSLTRYNSAGKPYSSISNLVVARGDSTHSFPTYTKQIEAKVRAAYNCVQWNPFPVDFWTDSGRGVGPQGAASVTMAANYSSVTELLDEVVYKAEEKYKVGAYLHWYTKYGCEQGDFDDAFDGVRTLSKNYHEAVT